MRNALRSGRADATLHDVCFILITQSDARMSGVADCGAEGEGETGKSAVARRSSRPQQPRRSSRAAAALRADAHLAIAAARCAPAKGAHCHSSASKGETQKTTRQPPVSTQKYAGTAASVRTVCLRVRKASETAADTWEARAGEAGANVLFRGMDASATF